MTTAVRKSRHFHEGTLAPPGQYDWACASFGLPESTTQKANRSVQLFLHSSRKSVVGDTWLIWLNLCILRPLGAAVHGRKSRGGAHPPEFVLRGTAMMFVPPEFSTYTVLNNAIYPLLWSPYVIGQTIIFMVALCNRADHNIFMLFLLLSFFLLSFSFLA